MHPMAFAAWFGLLATALNLFPIGQLDGGHISYAVLGRRSSYVTLAMVGVAVVLCFFSPSWIVWTVLMIVMLIVVRPAPSAHVRRGRAARPHAAAPWRRSRSVMFVLCFTPAPIELLVNP